MTSLIQKVLAGDSKATLEFYRHFNPKITQYVKKKLATDEDVQEIVNDIFLEAIDSLPRLRLHENVLAWLYSIAHHKIVDFYRKKKIKSVLLSQAPFLEIMEKEINQPEFIFEKNKIRDSIEQTLKSLSEKYQKILRLHYEENIPMKEVAKKLNVSFKAAESMLFRARQSFKKIYGLDNR